jgi:hypothetical protein
MTHRKNCGCKNSPLPVSSAGLFPFFTGETTALADATAKSFMIAETGTMCECRRERAIVRQHAHTLYPCSIQLGKGL